MFRQTPAISAAAVFTAALITLLGVLFASSLSSPGTAHADHSSKPTVSIKSITPDVGEEGGSLRITLELSRPLTADEKYCYNDKGPPSETSRKDFVCIEGGVHVWDTYNDHIDTAAGHVGADRNIKFVFYGSNTEVRLSNHNIADDECITPGREIRVGINTSFEDRPGENIYGYIVDHTIHTVRIAGNDTTNGPIYDDKGTDDTSDDTGKCLAVDESATEDVFVNQAPRFGNQTIEYSVNENTESGENIGDPVTASDPDEGDTLTYSLTGTDASHFDIDSSTGQIETDGPLDHESKDTYYVAVAVTDGKDIEGNSDSAEDDSIGVIITVNDVNEPPVFDTGAPTDLNVVENTEAGVDFGDPVTATDPDDGDVVSYSLDTGDGASFDIDEGTGQIKTKGALDRETKASYTVTVTASDGDEEATHEVTITVTEANDPPAFKDDQGQVQTSTTREVAENTAAGQPVGAPVAATDEENDPLTYSLGGTDAAAFDIDTSSGQIKVKDALDYEGGTTRYSVTVSVTDSKDEAGSAEDPAVEDASVDVTINVTDVNEGPTFDSSNTATREVAENTATDTVFGDVFTVTDPESDTPTYSLGGTDAASFDIDTATGQLMTETELDHESKDSYSITIQVTDGKAADGSTETTATIDDTHDVTITVTDADDPGVITFSADPPSAGTELTATLSDQDGVKTSPAVTWAWESSPSGTDTWTLINGETTNSYTPGTDDVGDYLRVTATYADDHSQGQTALKVSQAVLTAPPTNQNPEFDSNASTTRSVPENTPAGEKIGAPASATHGDSKGTLVYSLDATGATNFDIDAATGQLKTKTVFDFETDTTSYTVTVSVKDGMDDYSNADSTEDDTIDITINVTDMDVPAIPAAPTVNAANGAAAKLNVSWTAVTATTTAPVDGYDLQYREKDADPVDDWTALSVTTNSATLTTDLDYSKTYEVQVRSKNVEGESDWSPTGEGSIPSLLNVTLSPASRTVDEGNSGSFTVTVSPAADRALRIPVSIAAGTAESGDYSPTSRTVTFADTETSKTFSITTTNDSDRDDETVNIRFGTLPPAVGTGSQSTATLNINDTTTVPRSITTNNGGGGNGGTSTKTPGGSGVGSINTPKANQAPEFTEGARTTREIAEKTPAGTSIGAPISATDADKDVLTYSLGGMDASSFALDTGTGQLRTRAELDFELKPSYSLAVSVSDGRGGSDSIGVTVTVSDVVEVPVTDEEHQVVVLVDPDEETEVSTVGEDGTVTFPENTRDGPFFVRIDTNPDNCDWDSLEDPPAEELRACIKVEVFDTQGNPIVGENILDPAITIKVRLDGDDVGTDTLQAFMESGEEWTELVFSREDEEGTITVSIGGIDGPGLYAVGSNASQQQVREIIQPPVVRSEPQQARSPESSVPPVVPQPVPQPKEDPTPTPQPTATPEPTAAPTPTPSPTPEPSAALAPAPAATPTATPLPSPTPQPTATPQPTPTPTPDPGDGTSESQQSRVVLAQFTDLDVPSGPSSPQLFPFDFTDDDGRLRIWPIVLIAVGVLMELIALSLFLKEREADRRRIF